VIGQIMFRRFGQVVVYVRACSTSKHADPISNKLTAGTKSVTRNVPPRFVLNEADITETFCRGSGPGGQSVNKSMNKVRLVHIPTGISVASHDQRDLTSNRSIARKLLRDKVDLFLNDADSKLGKRKARILKRKQKSAR
jgi:peptide chain release factor